MEAGYGFGAGLEQGGEELADASVACLCEGFLVGAGQFAYLGVVTCGGVVTTPDVATRQAEVAACRVADLGLGDLSCVASDRSAAICALAAAGLSRG